MGTEIERKYLVDVEAVRPLLENPKSIVQGFLSFVPTVRVRRTEYEAELTVKGKGTLVRPEFNYRISLMDAEEMLRMCQGNLIEKTRHRVGPWEIDEFHGLLQGLWLAEIEMLSVDMVVRCPAWIGREVTEDKRYTNAYMAQHGLPPLE